MKNIIFVAILLVCFSSSALAWNPFETVEQSRQRHSAENYEYQQKYGTPLGGYPEKLGDPAPRGVEYPGYRPSYGIYDSDSDSKYDYDLRY